MNPKDMRPGIRYIVTESFSDKFREGDSVWADVEGTFLIGNIDKDTVVGCYDPADGDTVSPEFEVEVWRDRELEKIISESIKEGEVSLDDMIAIYRQSAVISATQGREATQESKELWKVAEWLESYRDSLKSASVSLDGMKPGIDYIVTRCSSNGDIIEGDILRLKDDGTILARNQRSKFLWIEKEELEKNCACSDFQVMEYRGEVCYDPAGKPDSEDCIEACLQESGYRIGLEEAIKHAEEASEQLARKHILEGQECLRCAIEHKQLADWLKELLNLRKATEYMNKPISDSPYAETIAESRESVSEMEECISRVYEAIMSARKG